MSVLPVPASDSPCPGSDRLPILLRSLSCVCLGASLAVIASSCGGGGGGGAGGGTPIGNDPVAATLGQLGVNTAQTPRQTDNGVSVDDNYSPFGKTWKLSTTHELLVVGAELDMAGNDPFALVDVANDSVSLSRTAGETPWEESEQSFFRSSPVRRAAVGADLDGDGLEEGVVVYLQGIEVRVATVSNAPNGPVTDDVQIAARSNLTHCTAIGGDLDGDGLDELIVGLTEDRQFGEVTVWSRKNGFFEQVAQSGTFQRTTANGDLWFRMAAGDIDRDSRDELVVVANSTWPDNAGSARYVVLDDLSEGFVELASDAVAATDENGQLIDCVTADVSIGDIDGDAAGEIVLGGMRTFPESQTCPPANYFAYVIEDLALGLIERQGHTFRTLWTGGSGSCNSPETPDVYFAFVGTFDVDGDGIDEIHVNEHVFEDFASAAPWTEPAELALPRTVIYERNNFGHFHINSADMHTADFDGDDREDLVIFRQENRFEIWGYGQLDTEIGLKRSYEGNYRNAQTRA
jgi:hypothetical protein